MGVFFSDPVFRDRPEWGVFVNIFPDFWLPGWESGIIDTNGGKTGLFKPVWLADLLIDQTYLLMAGVWGKVIFWD